MIRDFLYKKSNYSIILFVFLTGVFFLFSTVRAANPLHPMEQIISVLPASISSVGWNHADAVASHDLDESAVLQNFTSANSAVFNSTQDTNLPPATVPSQPNTTPIPSSAVPAGDENGIFDAPDSTPSSTSGSIPADTTIGSEISVPDGTVLSSPLEATLPPTEVAPIPDTVPPPPEPAEIVAPPPTDLPSDSPISISVPSQSIVWGVFPLARVAFPLAQFSTLASTAEASLTDTVAPDTTTSSRESIDVLSSTTDSTVTVPPPPSTVSPMYTIVPAPHNSITLSNFSLPKLRTGQILQTVQLRLSLGGSYTPPPGMTTLPSLDVSYTVDSFTGNAGSILLDGEVSNAMNGGYYLLTLPVFSDPAVLKNLSITITYQGDVSRLSHLYIDSAWLEIATATFDASVLKDRYQPSALEHLAMPKHMDFLSAETDFTRTETPQFTLKYKSQRNLMVQMFRGLLGKDLATIQSVAFMHGDDGLIGITPTVNITTDGLISIVLSEADKSKLQPGEYTVAVEVDEGGYVSTDSFQFQWGLLSINTNQTEYTSGDVVNFSMGALSPNGNTVCDAHLNLYVTDPQGVITMVPTTESGLCHGNNVVNVPDYSAQMVASEFGTYQTYLERVDDTGAIIAHTSDSFTVVSNQRITIERNGPTRIFPPAPYPMQLTVTTQAGFVGQLIERVPNNFIITDTTATIRKTPNAIELVWDLDLVAGSAETLYYTFDAPDLSPFLYQLGPASLESTKPITLTTVVSPPATLTATPAPGTTTIEFATITPATTDIFASSTSSTGTTSSPIVNTPEVVMTTTSTYTAFTELRQWQIASDATGNMILFWDDGASIPVGWTCLSCGSGTFFQKFAYGGSIYNTIGGALTTTPTATGNVNITTNPATTRNGAGTISPQTHTHTYTPTISAASTLPSYRQLRVIEYTAAAGEPPSLPAGAIGVFDTSILPTGWTQYSAEDGYYIYGENIPGTTGGSNTHTHTITGTSGAAAGVGTRVQTGGVQAVGAAGAHTHTVSTTTPALNTEPPYLEVVLGKLGSATSSPNDLISMWTDTVPTGWLDVSSTGGDPFNNRFLKASTTYGTTGGAATHTFPNMNGITTSVPSGTTNSRNTAPVAGASGFHTHLVDVTAFSAESSLPPYLTVIFGKRIGFNAWYTQTSFRWYVNNNALTPTDAWPVGGTDLIEAEPITATSSPVKPGQTIRLRINTTVSNVIAATGSTFKLQYAEGTVCSTIPSWTDVGSSTAAEIWRGYNNAGASDHATLASSVLSASNVNETYEENGVATGTPNAIPITNVGEWDFVLQNNGALANTQYCFQMVKGDGSAFLAYDTYPQLLTNSNPNVSVIVTPFANEKVMSATTSLSFYATDTESDVLEYEVMIDDTYDFSSPVLTKTSANYPTDAGWSSATSSSGATTTYVIQPADALSSGTTYWWKVRARDPDGSNTWSNYSSATSFTVDTTLIENAWHQTLGLQFERDSLTNISTTTGTAEMTSIVSPGLDTITTQSAWAQEYANTTYPAGTVNGAYTISAGSNRVLLVAVASTRTTVGTQTVTVSYGGQPLTLATGDGTNAANRNHTYLFYLNEAGITAAAGANLDVTVSGGVSFYTFVYASVYTGVDQSTVYTDAQNFNSAVANNAVGPFATGLTVAAGDQAIEVINLARSATGNAARTIATWSNGTWPAPSTVATVYQVAGAYNLGLHINNRNVTTLATETSQHTANSAGTVDSMSGISLKPAALTATAVVMSPEIDSALVPGYTNWGQLSWGVTEPSGTLTSLQVYYSNVTACDTLVPDGDLPGNSTGFTSASSGMFLNSLAMATYSKLCLKLTLGIGTGSTTPSLTDWTLTWVIPNQPPSVPALADTPAFDNDKATTTTPSVGGFVSSDLDLDSMQYQIEVDTNADFSSPILSKQSANYPTDAGWVAATFSADATTTYTIQPADALTDGATYWWRVRARDPFGTNTWSNYSVARSFTVSTAITVPEWFQTTDEQFATTATFSNATTTGSGGVTIDNPTVTVSELDAWSTGNTKTVSVGTDRLLVVAIISEDSGTNSTVSSVTYGGQNLIPIDNQQIGTGFSNGLWLGYLDEAGIAAAANSTIAPSWVGGTPNNGIEYASAVYQHVNQTFPIRDQSGNALATGATITPVSSISALTGDMMVYVAETSNGLTHTPPAGYTEGTEQDTGGTGFVAASAYKAIVSNSTEYPTATWSASGNRLLMIAADLVPAAPRGTILSPEINFTSVIGQSQWGEVDWYLNELTGGNSRLRVYYTNAVACDTIIPDVALAGNAAGFISGGSPVDISSLATSTYNRICLQMTIDRGTASSSPELSDWGVRWQRTASFNQNAFWWYANTNADTPTDTWPVGVTGSELVENQVMDSGYPSQFSDVLRLRLGVGVSAVTATGKSFKLQYAAGAVCSDTMSWADVGPIGSTTALWRGYNNAGVSDGATLTSALLSGTNVLETYEAENNATAMPNAIPAGQNGEWDWVLQNEAAAGTSYCFRLVNPDGSRFKTYAQYPMVVTNQSPTIASIDTPFDNQKTPNLKPSFTFAGLDPESDDIDYQIQIDDNSDFSSAVVDANSIANYTDFNNVLNPSDKSPFNSGETIEYIPPSSLTNGVTYWWRVRAKDTNASTQYEAWSTPQSFTIDTSVVLTTWFQTTEAQFGTDSLEGTEATPSNLVDFISGSTTGTTTSTAIRFSDVTSGNAWGTFTFSDTGLASDILYHFEYYNGTIWQLIPDTDLVANSTGFDTSPVDLIDLNTETYNTIRIRANFNAGSPTLTDWTVVAGERVAVPTHFSLFDNEKTGTTTPTFTFLSTDPQGDDLQYEFSWSTDATFVSGSTTVNSTTSPGFIDVTNGVDTNPYASGHTISYTMQSGLTDGTTYWWRVRAKDPYGGNSYSFWSDPWSFTVDVTATTSTWFQTTKAQFDTDTLVGLVATTSGSVSTVPAAVTTYNFNGITNPSASNIARNFRITVTDPTYPPLYDAIDTITTNGTNTGVPNLLSGIAGYSSSVELSSANYTSISAIDANRFTTANPGVTRESVFWAEIPIAQTASQIAQIDLHLVGYQGGTPAVGQKAWFGIWQPGSTTPYWQALETAQFTTDHTYTGSITSNFSKYFDGNNALHLIFYNENAGSRLLINYVEAVVTSNSATSGTITSTPITFTDGAGPAWNSFSWNDIRPGASTVTYQIEYQNGVGGWALIPDTDLPGNAAGFSVSPVDLSGLDTTTYGVIRTIAQLTCSGANCPTVNDWTVKWSPGYTVSGTAYEYDGTTPVISGTVNVAVNGVLQAGKSSPISAGAWSIPDVTYFPNDIITVFVSGAADADEAVAITKYATVPNITGLQLQKRHLTIGSADHTTITNTDMSLYDNTNDEDLFFAVNAGNDVTMCADVGCDDAGLVILANNTYAPGAGADVVTHDIRNDGTLTLSNTILRVGGSWDNNATTSMGASTVVFTATSTSEIIDSTGANSASFYNVTLGETSGTATWTLASTFTVGHDLGVTYGTLARGIESIDIAAALTTGPAGYWTGMGTTTFNGTAVSTWIDSNATKQNIGQVVVNGTAHTLLLGSNTLAQSMTIVSGNTLDLSTNTRVLQIASDWYNGGTFQARNGKVSFVATSVNHSINVGGASFYNLDFAGVGGAWSFMQSTLTVSNNFTLATGTVTLPSATTTFAGSFINTGGTFVHNNGTAKFTAASAKTITMLGTTFTNAFYDLTFTGAGSWVITDVTATSSHTVTKSAGTLTLPSGTFAVGGSFLNTGGSLVANDGTLELFSTSAQTLSVNTSSLYNLIKTGTGTTTMTDPDVTITNNLLVTSGTLVLPSGTLTLSGSLTNTGVLSPQTGTILLNAVTTGKTVSTGASSLYNLTFNSVPGGWTVMDNATTTGTTTLSAGTFTLAAGKTLAVDGVFVNALDDASTTWTGSTLSLGSGAYTINTKTTGADSYGTLRLEPNVDIQMWNSLAATTTVDITSSLYSQDHNAVDGSLYIWGDYHRTTGSDYWDYATDFDGTALASSSRLVSVKFAPSASYSLDAGTLEVLGTTTATTSVDNQGSGTYAMSIKGGTFNAQYYTFRNLDALGLNFTGTPTVTSLSDGDVQVAVNGGSMITVSSSTIGANIAKQIYRINFATSSGITSGHNVAVSAGNGTPVHGIYSTAGTSTFVVPDGVTSMTLKVWSAGAGGAGGGGGTSAGGAGGGGGFITGTIAVVPGESLTLVVGSGGGGGTGDATNGGGGGGGGGYSAVLRGSTKLFVAGAGGAGGGGDNATGGTGGAGGPGGGAIGGNGVTSGTGIRGTGGTQTTGGTGGTGACDFNGSNGGLFTGGAGGGGVLAGAGGAGGTNSGGTGGSGQNVGSRAGGGGGGGAGYYGGGGGCSDTTTDGTGGGGGGSSYAISTATATSTTAGSGMTAGNVGDADYGGSSGQGGTGGAAGSGLGGNGNPGRIAVVYTPLLNDAPSYWWFRSSTGNLQGEAYDVDPAGDPGIIRWDNSTYGITISGTVYADEGVTLMGAPVCDDVTPVVKIVIDGSTSYTGACSSASSTYSISGITYTGDPNVLVYLDTNGAAAQPPAVTLHSETTGSGTTNPGTGVIVINRAATISNGDLLVVIAGKSSTAALTAPAGWTTGDTLASTVGNTMYTGIWYKRVIDAATEPTSYNFIGNTSAAVSYWSGALTHVDPVNPQDVSFSGKWVNSQNDTTPNAALVTTTVNGDYVLAASYINADNAVTAPGAPWATRAVNVFVGGDNSNLVVSSQTKTPAGSTAQTTVSGVAVGADSQNAQFSFRRLTYASSSVHAAVLTRTPTADIADLAMYGNRVITRHENAATLAISNMIGYDYTNDSDLPFTAVSGTPNVVTVRPNTELHIWTGTTFTPGGTVTIQSGGTANAYDGSVHLDTGAHYTASGVNTFSFGGNLTQGASAVFSPASSSVIMTATTTGKTITASGGDTVAFHNLQFDGSGGGWNLNSDITATGDIQVTTGTVTGTKNITVSNGSLSGNGLLSLGAGTVQLTMTNTLGGTQPWTFANLTLGNGSIVGTTTPAGTATTTVSGVLTIANAHYLNATSSTWDLSGTGTPFIKTGNFIFGTSRFRYSGAGANVTATTFYDLDLNAAVGSPTYTALGSGLAVAHNLTVGGTAATTANFTTNDPAVSVDGNLTIASNGIVLASDSAHLSLAGSYTNNGTFTSNGGTVIFTGSSPQSITPGGSSFATLTVTGSGDYTMLNNATATIAFTLASTSVFTLTATKTMAVGGTFTNDSGSTTWAGSTLYLYGAGNYQINDKSVSDTYGALQIGTNTHIRAWNSSADTVTTEAGASLYSMDHAGADGDLYVYGSYYKTSGTDDWSYATDFDGTALGGSSRPAHVYLQGGASAVFQSGGALSVLGMSTASTTIQNQGSGVYTLAVGSAGSTTMQYYAIQNAGVAGLTLAGTATVGTLSYGSFLVANDSDSGMTVAGSVIDANPAKTFTGNSFATSSGVTSAYNVTATGTAVSSWRFTNHSGTLAGEAYDNDPGGDPGYIVWADSASAITVSGHVYSDEGLTVSSACNGSSDITITVGGITSTSTNCNAGTGLYSFAGITFSPGDSFIVYINGVAQKAATVTVDPISNISDFDLYEHRVIVRHEDTNPIIIDDLAGYDSSDDADIPFTATNGSPDTLLLPADTMLLVWGSKTFAPGGNVTVSGGGAGADYDGSVRLLSNATWTGVGTQLFSFGGSFQLDAGATFTAGNSTTTFTTSGIGRVIDVNGNQFYNVSFTGSGDWNVTDSTLSTHNLVMTNGVLTLPLATTTLSGGLDVTGGSFITNNSPLVFTATTADTTVRFGGSNVADLLFAGSGSWIMKDTNATSTGSMTVSAGTVTLPSGSLAVAHNFLTTGGTITHNNDRLVLTSTSSALLKAGNSNLGSVVFAGVGPFTMADTNLTLVGDLVIATGTVTFASGTLSVGGSFDTLNGAFDNATGTVLFNASAVGKTINPGVSPFYNLQIGAPSGEYTLESATTTNNFTLASVTSFTLNAGATLTVNGVFTNSVGGSATTWLDSTLNVTSGTNYSINGKTTGGDRYETLIIGPNTDISSWNTSATATVVAENSSWYSKDHAGVDGSLYIFGDYHISTTTHYWSYATDFDGTALGGTPRDVTVSFAANATTTMTSGALNIIGASGHETTLTNQGSGTYAFTVSGGILNAQHYAFRNLDENGLSLSGTANITSLSYGDFALAVSGGSLITLDAGTLNANASLVSTGNVFATTTAITGYNVTLVGSTASAWTFIGHTGNLAGEAFDNDGVDACGQIRWSDSACLLTQETHYRWRNDDGGIGVPNSEWYDVNWGARQRVRIANADATTYTDAAVELTVPYDTDMQSSFGDLRFTDSSGTTSLPYFIASTTPSVSAEVWVKVPSVPASDTATIYMYYKNATSTSIGSSTQVFIAADDFEDNSISEYAGDTTLFTTGTGFAYGGSRGLDNVGHVNAKANTGIGRLDQTISQGQTIEYKQYIDTTGHGDEVCTLFGIQSVASSTNYAVCLEQFGTHRLSLVKNAKNTDSSGVVLASTTVTFSSGWYDVSVDWKTSNGIDVTLSQGGVVVATTTATDSSYTSGGYGFTYWINYGGWDNFTARPYLTTAPTIYFGTKQGNGGATWRVAQDVTGSGYTTGDTARLRVAIENTGTLVNHTYQLEYAPMGVALSCEAVAAGSFVAVAPSASCGTDAICMATSSVVSDGTVTSDLLNISNGNFVTGSFVSDPSNSAATISIPTNAYTEVEYTLTLTPYVTDQNLCFRVTDNGTDLDGYQAVAKISLQFDPVFGPVSVNGGQDIVLTPGATTTIYATGTVTDYNGYSDIVAGTSTLYRSGAGAACSPDDNNCYISTTNNACSFTNCAGNTCTMACSVDMYYFADPTDAGTYIGEDWEAYLEVNDTGGGYDFASALPVEVLSLRALTVDNAINYGALSVNTNTGTYNASTTVVNDGNTPFDVEIDGSDLTDGASSIIPASEQKFASSTFDYSACVSCAVASSTAPVLVGIDLLKPTVATPPVSAPIYWGIAVPLGVNSAPHQGINVLTPVLP